MSTYEAFVGAWQESKLTMERLAQAVASFAPKLNQEVATQQETEAASAARMS